MRIFFIGTFLALLVSCSNYARKSVFEKIDEKELIEIAKKNPDFVNLYESIRLLDSTFTINDKAKFADVSYKDIIDLKEYIDKNESKFKNEYKNIYGNHEFQADSIINYWISYKDKIHNSVSIRLKSIYKTYYEYIGGIDDCFFNFEFTPNYGSIEQFRFKYKYYSKLYTSDTGIEEHYCRYQETLNKTNTGLYDVGYSDKEKIGYYKNASEFLDKNYMDFIVTAYRQNGVTYDEQDIPYDIQRYLEESESDKNLNKEDNIWYNSIIREYIDSNYISFDAYKNEKRYEKDSLTQNFVEILDIKLLGLKYIK